MKKKFAKGFLWFLIGFATFFGLRMLYGYVVYPDGVDHTYEYYEDDGFTFSVRNFASYDYGYAKAGGMIAKGAVPEAPDAGDASGTNGAMKYEKVGVVRSRSSDFDRDRQRVRSVIAAFGALVQFEQMSGLKGHRVLHLGLGVVPEQFDTVVARLQAVGRLKTIRVDKTDKTNEYRELRAKRTSLEKTRDALLALKSRGGSVDESITLENRIFDIEEQLQALGVRLGEFDTENEFCTVKYSLNESRSLVIPLMTRIKTAFEWTVKFFLGLMTVLALGAVVVLIIVVLLEKLHWIPPMAARAFNSEKTHSGQS